MAWEYRNPPGYVRCKFLVNGELVGFDYTPIINLIPMGADDATEDTGDDPDSGDAMDDYD